MSTAVIYYSRHHENTKKLVDAIKKANPEIKRKHIQNVTRQIIDHDDFTVEQQEDLLSWLKNNL